jgi:hypothetical protein
MINSLEILHKFIESNRESFSKKEWSEIHIFIDSTTGILDVERHFLRKESTCP